MTERPAPSAELRARVFDEVARARAPTRAEHRTWTLAIAVVTSLATTALFFAMGGFARGVRPTELVAFTAGLGLVAAIAVTGVSVGPTTSMLGRPRHELVLMCVALAPTLAVVALAATAIWPLALGDQAEGAVSGRTHLACGLMTVVQGALPLAALVVARSGTDPVHPAVTGAALGTTAGAWTAMMAYLRCPHAAPLHTLLAHVGPTVLFTIGGILLGRAALSVKSVKSVKPPA